MSTIDGNFFTWLKVKQSNLGINIQSYYYRLQTIKSDLFNLPAY